MNTVSCNAIVDRTELRAALAALLPIIPRRAGIEVLQYARLKSDGDDLVMSATDLDITASYRMPGCPGNPAFAAVLPGHQLAALDKQAGATGRVHIAATETSREVTRRRDGRDVVETETDATAALDFGTLRSTMRGRPVADWPEFKLEGDVRADFTIPTKALADAFAAVDFAISKEETRFYLNGIFMHVSDDHGAGGPTLRFVATDGHRMAVHSMPAPDGAAGMPGVILPRQSVAYLRKLAKAKTAPETVSVVVNSVKALFTLGRVDILTKLIDGSFPDYGRVIPPADTGAALTVDRKAFMAAIGAVAAVADRKGHPVKLTAKAGSLNLEMHSETHGTAAQTIEAIYPAAADPVEIGFNSSYLLDLAKAIGSDRMTFMLHDNGAPTRVFGDASPTLYVQMPMRV